MIKMSGDAFQLAIYEPVISGSELPRDALVALTCALEMVAPHTTNLASDETGVAADILDIICVVSGLDRDTEQQPLQVVTAVPNRINHRHLYICLMPRFEAESLIECMKSETVIRRDGYVAFLLGHIKLNC